MMHAYLGGRCNQGHHSRGARAHRLHVGRLQSLLELLDLAPLGHQLHLWHMPVSKNLAAYTCLCGYALTDLSGSAYFKSCKSCGPCRRRCNYSCHPTLHYEQHYQRHC